ncbi:MAG: hypothetical protein HY366_01725 [Candidatus Aenigmarchaeota archaeon]|nr:hypothetical protein [Candidatus Aenigmarchaeota archaeon]
MFRLAKRKPKRKQPSNVVPMIAVLFLIMLLVITSQTKTASSQIHLAQASPIPEGGFQTSIMLGNAIPKLVESGAIDIEKFKEVYGGTLTEEQTNLLTKPSTQPLALTKENERFILNVLWALGIANKNPILDESAKYDGIANLASTGGWTLGKADAMTYFNKLEIVKLTPDQQTLVERVADNVYRPCCDNPTAFPDCNHGAAMLALLELGASQGLNEDELYTLALQANTLWFEGQYAATATLLATEGKDYWGSARAVVSAKYSSGSGWFSNVYGPLQKQGLLPKSGSGGSCGA